MLFLSSPQERVVRIFRAHDDADDSSVRHTTRAALRVVEVSEWVDIYVLIHIQSVDREDNDHIFTY